MAGDDPRTPDALLDAFKTMTLDELSDFVKLFESSFSVTVVHSSPNQASDDRGEFDVILDAAGEKKIAVIREVRALTSLGLKEAKDLVDSHPKPVLLKVSLDRARWAAKHLEAVGAVVKVSGPLAFIDRPHPEDLFGIELQERVLSRLSTDEIERVIAADSPALRTARMTALVEVADAFISAWDAALFPAWLFAPSAHLDGFSPADFVAAADSASLMSLIDEQAYGVYA